jgi:Phage ABA sandwich domain
MGTLDWQTMPAGPELDALVAERVMGLAGGEDFGDKPDHNWRELDGDEQDFHQSTYECGRCHRRPGWLVEDELPHGPCRLGPRPYSTNIAAAWQIVEHALAVEVTYDNEPPRWRCYIDLGYARFATVRDQPSAPLAICRAALTAKKMG